MVVLPLTFPLLSFTVKDLLLDLDVISKPTSLTFISEQSTMSRCFSTFFREDGGLLIGCEDGVRLLKDGSLEMLVEYGTNYNIDDYEPEHDQYDIIFIEDEYRTATWAVDHRNTLFIIRADNDKAVLEVMSPGQQEKEHLIELPGSFPSDEFFDLTVSDKYVVCAVAGDENLVLYNRWTKERSSYELSDSPDSIHFLPDGDLLVSKYHLTRYKIEDGELQEIWDVELECEHMHASICTDDGKGVIYVHVVPFYGYSYIHVFSSQGRLIQLDIYVTVF